MEVGESGEEGGVVKGVISAPSSWGMLGGEGWVG